MRAPGIDAHAEDALRTDTYVSQLLDAVEARRPAEPRVPDADPAVAMAARALRESLGRSHPSFRFEERLSRRLAELALAMRRAASVGGSPDRAAADAAIGWTAALATVRDRRPGGQLIAFPTAVAADGDASAATPGRGGVRPVLAGGAVASAAISIGAAALVAWRRTHVRRGIV